MNLYLHIGTEKTGSSYIQSLFALNRNQLKEFNICYPKTRKWEEDQMSSGKISPGNGLFLYESLKKRDLQEVRKIIINFVNEANSQNCNTVLISNENLIEPLSDNSIYEQFNKICKKENVNINKLIVIIRDPVDQALSLYKHRAKNGNIAHVKDWIKNEYSLAEDLDNFLTVAEENHINCLYRRYKRDSEWMKFTFFKEWLQINVPDKDYSGSVNPSLTISELYLLKCLYNKNEYLANNFYNYMLDIPISDKDRNHEIESSYKDVIESHLSNYTSSWSRCNNFLGQNNEFIIPNTKIKSIEGDQPDDRFCFSDKQLKMIAKFTVQTTTVSFKTKGLIYNLINFLRNFKSSIFNKK